ncbi:hypothetical protein P3X46_014249 [Hevea brasiliensis]|uniref:Plant-specific domain TIGR01615 family protein n=1 Tax=Hevea brasiliensis TaxID=3981 RepID=A0ABQ9M697_HEVBR|nr:uncharacterized protein LOC110644127 [Hevea brasiliensis]KAJ9175721.1 hypothetical protein P3X46_014249 [Hevea brasiliensis]
MCAAAATGDWWARGIAGQIGGGFSHESELDLALMVSEFLENGGSSGADSLCSSDSESGLSDLHHLADKISFYRHSGAQYESDLLSLVHSLMVSIKETDLRLVKSGPCNASCIRFSLVKLLRLAGYDAAVCTSRWQGGGKVPGGDHEYVDVVNYNGGSSERLIIDIDFQSHFEIARAVDSYDRILKSLPVIYLGSMTRLKQYLQVMVEAAKSSLKQNSMPLPPWRSLAYLQAKWQSPYERHWSPEEQNFSSINSSDHKQCSGHLKRLQSSLQSEVEEERLLKPMNTDNWRVKRERRRHSLLRGL